jgi:hypothetical protein
MEGEFLSLKINALHSFIHNAGADLAGWDIVGRDIRNRFHQVK